MADLDERGAIGTEHVAEAVQNGELDCPPEVVEQPRR
jgi:hypothetical protein